ncbi:MAG TPA: SPFH domain-containing protein [Candidatus Binataceae bacterium]|nr:SPFH domain-containing protein [Candidatus Binataceae bacterium]
MKLVKIERGHDVFAVAREIAFRLGFILLALLVLMFAWSVAGRLISSTSNLGVGAGFVVLILAVAGGGLALFRITWEGIRNVRHLLLAAVLILVSLGGSGCGWTKVPPGWVGIKVDLYGKQRGVQDFPLQTGMVWYNPWTTEVYTYPTFMQQAIWTASPHEGRPVDESFTVNTVEGVSANFDCAMGYHIDAAKVPALFIEFRQSAESLTDSYIRNTVRKAFSDEVSAMKVIDLYGRGKAPLEATVAKQVDDVIAPKGVHVDYINIIGKIRLPENVEGAINNTIQAQQDAQRAQAVVAQKEAEAKQQVAEAQGQAQSVYIRAKGEADAVLAKAQAQAQANDLLNKSITPSLIEYQRTLQWNGVLPQYVLGNSIPMLNLGAIGSSKQ